MYALEQRHGVRTVRDHKFEPAIMSEPFVRRVMGVIDRLQKWLVSSVDLCYQKLVRVRYSLSVRILGGIDSLRVSLARGMESLKVRVKSGIDSLLRRLVRSLDSLRINLVRGIDSFLKRLICALN